MPNARARFNLKSWIPTLSVAFAAFIFVTSEFIPVGLLSDMARAFNRTESETGIVMTVYAWIVAVLSIPLTAYVARFDRKPLMLTLVAIFVLAHVFTVFAPTFDLLIASRLFVAAAHAVFWAVATPLGIRLAPKGQREIAMTVVATGATLGGVLGIPIGTFLGQLISWRFSFGLIGFTAFVIGVVLWRTMPQTPSQNSGDFRSVGPLLKRKSLLLVYALTAVMMTGHYTAFTFISPYLQFVAHFSSELVAPVLLVYGCAGLIGGFVAPPLVKNRFKPSGLIAISIVALSLFALRFALSSYALTLLTIFVWGVSFVFFNLILQNLILAFAPDAEDVAMAGYSGIYNLGIGSGALFGSLSAVSHLDKIGFVGAGFVAVAVLICAYIFRSYAIRFTQISVSAP